MMSDMYELFARTAEQLEAEQRLRAAKSNPLDEAWAQINALGGSTTSGDEYGIAYNEAISDTLTILEKLGACDPLLKEQAE